jgi:UDP-4-amino-4,6-dideoxy-N-acetyl-beta-L-altrosamine transaminase
MIPGDPRRPWESVEGPILPYARQSIAPEDAAAVASALGSDWLTQGPRIRQFEEAMAARCGARHAVAVSSGTAGLHIGALALGLGPGKRLWTTPNTFVASANCGRYCGAEVDFCDIDPATLNLGIAPLRAKLEAARRDNRLPDVVVPVHFSGRPCEMEEIGKLAREFGFAVMEDAAHAVGATDGPDPVGACRHSDLAVFSFHPVKILTTGEGGMVLTNRDDLRDALLELRTHGITREPSRMTRPPEGPWSYEQTGMGFHYRITDIQCALGLSQMGRLDAFLARRRELAARYDRLLEGLPLVRPATDRLADSSWHLYVVRVPATARAAVFDGLRADGIGANVHYIPVHTQPVYRQLGFADGDFPEAERYYREAISLPLFFGLTDGDQERVVESLARHLRRCGVA